MDPIDLLALRQRMYRDRDDAERTMDAAIGIYKQCASYIEAIHDLQAECKQTISDILVEWAEISAETPSGKCYVTAPGVSVSYDRKALDDLCERDEEWARRLLPFRKESERPGSLTIR